MPKQASPPSSGGKYAKSNDAVADDRNWVGRIQNELNCTAVWDKDWGFLAGGAENLSIDKATIYYTIDDKIKMIEDEIQKLKNKDNHKTANQVYGSGVNLEKFPVTDYNNHKIIDLKPVDRKLAKEWKKDRKWKAPDDEFDELKNLFSKKGKKK